ncbi:hypothetical protein KKG46_01695, partial [Patescibacteria group bacterium]|nr:hypothetical protein [Patescibacteria group bacterium]
MATTTDQAQAIMEIQTDSDGNWEAQVPQTLSPGMHKVMVETEDGEQQDLALFNMPIRTEVIENTTSADYGQYIYPLALLVVLVLVLAANSLRLLVKAKKIKKELANKQRFTTLFTVFAALIAVAIFIYVAYQSGWLDSTTTNNNFNQTSNLSNDKQNDSSPTEYVGVSGLVIDPQSDIGVSDVDLSAYDISIRTQEGGAYNFASIPSDG